MLCLAAGDRFRADCGDSGTDRDWQQCGVHHSHGSCHGDRGGWGSGGEHLIGWPYVVTWCDWLAGDCEAMSLAGF